LTNLVLEEDMNLHKYLKGQSSPTGVNFYDHICKIKEKAKKWLKPLDKNGISHSKRIEEYLNKLIPDEVIKEKWLSPAEVFVLLYAVYLHDIGYIKDDGTIDPKDHPKRSGEKIRNNWTAYCFSSEFFPPYQNEHPRAVEAVAIVCECHAPEVVCKLNEIPQEFSDHALDSEPLNLKRLTALLRLADEADDPYIRGKALQSYRKNVVLVEIKKDIIVWHWEADKWNKGVNRQEIGMELYDQIGEKEGLLESANEYLREFKLDKSLILKPKLSLSPSEIQTRVKLPEISVPTIQSVLRKGETFEGDFFKKEPEWIDFEEGFVIERKEIDEIIKKLENDSIQLVLGEPASGKSVILKNIGFKLANEGKDVYVVELKKHSRGESKRYFDDVLNLNDEKAVFIVDDAYLWLADCERLVKDFKNRKSKAKLIIGSRPTGEIRGEHPKEASEFEYLSKTDIHAEDVTEEMVRRFLKRKYGFRNERIERVSKNLERYKKDLWHLSWALKAYNPKKDSVEEKEIYEKIRDSIREIKLGKDESGKDKFLNVEDIFLPLSVFYRFEIPIERRFLEEQTGIEENITNQLIAISEITEMEERGKRRTLSLIHSSISELYFKTYQSYPDLGENVKKIFQGDGGDIEYRMFCQYMKLAPTNSLDAVTHLGEDWHDTKGGHTLLNKLIEDIKVKNSLKKSIAKERDIEKIELCVRRIAEASEGVALKLVDAVFSRIEKEEDIEKIGSCVRRVAWTNKEVGFKLANCIDIDILLVKIEIENDIEKIALCMEDIAGASQEAGSKLGNSIGEVLSSKIAKEEDLGKIGRCIKYISWASEEVGLELTNLIDIDILTPKVEKGKNIQRIASCVNNIAWANEKVAQEIVNRLNPKLREELIRWLK